MTKVAKVKIAGNLVLLLAIGCGGTEDRSPGGGSSTGGAQVDGGNHAGAGGQHAATDSGDGSGGTIASGGSGGVISSGGAGGTVTDGGMDEPDSDLPNDAGDSGDASPGPHDGAPSDSESDAADPDSGLSDAGQQFDPSCGCIELGGVNCCEECAAGNECDGTHTIATQCSYPASSMLVTRRVAGCEEEKTECGGYNRMIRTFDFSYSCGPDLVCVEQNDPPFLGACGPN